MRLIEIFATRFSACRLPGISQWTFNSYEQQLANELILTFCTTLFLGFNISAVNVSDLQMGLEVSVALADIRCSQ